MTRMTARCLIALLPVLVFAAPSARAAESYDACIGAVTALPVVLTSQGTYCLKKNLATNLSGGNAITIGSNNVTLDCNGFRIQGSSAGPATDAIGIQVPNRLNFRLKNCVIRGFRRGLDITGDGSAGHEIVGNRFEGNTQLAIYVQGTGTMVRRNLILDSGAMVAQGEVWGIYAYGDLDIIDNTIDGVRPSSGGSQWGSYGISVVASSTSVIRGNRIRNIDGGNSADYAIYTSSGTFASIEGNQLSRGNGGGNGNFGVYCGHTAIVSGNRLFGYGIPLVNCVDDGGNIDKP